MPPSRSATGFNHALRPGRMGPLDLGNRIVLPAMDMNLCDDGVLTDAEIAHYVARAAGGAAMIITGSGAVAYPEGATSQKQPGLSDDRFVDGLARLADAVRGAGSLLCVQLCHHGKSARLDMARNRPVLVPSLPEGPPDLSALVDTMPTELGRLAATTAGQAPEFREATANDLAWVIDRFADAAARVRRAGAHAVEIHAAHGYLLSSFLSPADNRRTDRWGGSIEGRARLTVEVTAAVRDAVGPDMAVIVRLNGQEFGRTANKTGAASRDSTASKTSADGLDNAAGLGNADAARAASLIEAAGADAIHVSGYGLNSFANFTDGPLPDTAGAYREQAAAIKRAVGVPVIAVGRITPELAEEMLNAGDSDFVSMGRQFLADPDLVAKLRSGRRPAIRPCINCYVCVEKNFFDDPPICAVNPELGNAQAPWEPVDEPRHVVVIGAGPAGMEVARIAAERGHRVTLLEAGNRLGGTTWFSQMTTPANGPLIDWQVSELERLGVEVARSTRADRATVEGLGADVVVVATGAVRGRPEIPGADRAHVRTGDELRALVLGEPGTGQPRWLRLLAPLTRTLGLTSDPNRIRSLTRRWMPLGRNVVIIGGGLVGLELSEFLAERGRSVTVLEPGGQLGLPMAMPRRWTAVRRAADLGVTLVRKAAVIEITTTEVRYEAGGNQHVLEANEVIVASEIHASSPLADELTGLGVEVHLVGDAGSIGYIEGAMHSAWSVARTL